MRSAVGIYDTHEKAVAAIKQLQAAGYPVNQLTIMGQGQIVEGEARIKSVSTIAVKEISIGATIGSILGVLVGVGVIAIPGLGFIVGAGALFGGFAGFEAGMLGGGIAAILTSIGIDLSGAARYQQHLKEGKFMVIIQGSQPEIDFAKQILHTTGEHLELNEH